MITQSDRDHIYDIFPFRDRFKSIENLPFPDFIDNIVKVSRKKLILDKGVAIVTESENRFYVEYTHAYISNGVH